MQGQRDGNLKNITNADYSPEIIQIWFVSSLVDPIVSSLIPDIAVLVIKNKIHVQLHQTNQ